MISIKKGFHSSLREETDRSSTPLPPENPTLMVWNINFNHDGTINNDKSFVNLRLKPHQPTAIRFTVSLGSEVSIQPVLYTNYPMNGTSYERNTFHSKPFTKIPNYDWICEFFILQPGPYKYYLEYKKYKVNEPTPKLLDQPVKPKELPSDTEDISSSLKPSKSYPDLITESFEMETHKTSIYHFLVNSPLSINNEPLDMDAVVLKTVNPKLMGPLSCWEKHISDTSKLGYNMIHFIPMQQRGDSDSPYSIYDQLMISDSLFSDMKTPPESREEREKMVKNVLVRMEETHKIISITDIVWNHTAHNSEWLHSHPEAGYNLKNSPHLRAAYEFDRELIELSKNIDRFGFPDRMIHTKNDVDKLIQTIKDNVIQKTKLWEFYIVDIPRLLSEVRDLLSKENTKLDQNNSSSYSVSQGSFVNPKNFDKLVEQTSDKILEAFPASNKYTKNNVYERYCRQPKAKLCCEIGREMLGKSATCDEIIDFLSKTLDLVNLIYYKEYDNDLESILTSIRNTVNFERFSKENWKYQKPINETYCIVDPLFTTLPRNATTSKFTEDELVLANNGWIWGGDPLNNFAEHTSKAYLRREVIVWGDCVKLNYGKSPKDNPWLWDYMKEYTMRMAKLFHGFRIDNCHSTPLELAEYFLDQARMVRPNIYILAELFTGSEESDRIFVSRLGINSLIRESINAWNIQELSRQIHRSGGIPIGTLDVDCLGIEGLFTDESVGMHDVPCIVAPFRSSLPHVMFFDVTHDNEMPAQKRLAEDSLSNAAAVTISPCAVGSNHGYDELYPELINLALEKRKYRLLDDPINTGIGRAKRDLNNLHRKIANFQEIFVHVDGEYITVHRIDPVTREGYFAVIRPAFKNSSKESSYLAPIKIYSSSVSHEFSYSLEINGPAPDNTSDGYIYGLQSTLKSLGPPIITLSEDENGSYSEIQLPENFLPGSILVVHTVLVNFRPDLDWKIKSNSHAPMEFLDLDALNVVLYRCNDEERDTIGVTAYDIPGLGPLPYCGYQGWMSHLKYIIPKNDLGHPLCDNLRAGFWAMDYIVSRLQKYSTLFPRLSHLISWLTERFALARNAPKNLAPRYFAMIVYTSWRQAIKRALSLMNPDFTMSTGFISRLALTSVQLLGKIPSASLYPHRDISTVCMSAGLPHFSNGFMRCWGRDIFIALDGLLLVTHRWEEARNHILAFGSVLRNGLIPNLLDSGRYPRYNARDATWFWLQAVQDYCIRSPEGLNFLFAEVLRRFPESEEYVEWDDISAYKRKSSIADLIYEILQKHGEGINFREWNAGPKLDEHMRDPGFDISINVDWNTGLIFGGNKWNCGTWMDKMGSSSKAGNKGVPSTPRDGADIEIIGLLKSCLRWVSSLNDNEPGLFQYEGIFIDISQLPNSKDCYKINTESGEKCLVTFEHWDKLVQSSFETHFWIPSDPSEDSNYAVNSKLVNRRGIYKDTYKSSTEWTDYQLRPNISVAMVVAPELFTVENARQCLGLMRQILHGPLGMRTLDPSDYQYQPNYDNSNDSDNPHLAAGANYHQGPEWVWCTGYFLRALLTFFSETADVTTSMYYDVLGTLTNLKNHIAHDKYVGLPELTNMDGSYCRDSCDTQAWSSATLLCLVRDLEEYLVDKGIEVY
ncbi:hypothetical protein BB559_001088 [Furculomyces boomerangus]|uniref:Glycogen debranching enzyme n=1 Tax=Furculomyces boomerangus TaxID=61424 RepID=A0A2T9Z375_9FUNG|nr:hypothetical protein BB559_001088 [Furculomyces boomerangus]